MSADQYARKAPPGTGHVVLVHGLWMHAGTLEYQGRVLREAGYTVSGYSYPSMQKPLGELAAGLARHINESAQERGVERVNVVAHSMGGIVALAWVADAIKTPGVQPGRLVMMGTPCRGSASGRALARLPMGSWMLGTNRDLWHTEHAERVVRVPDGVEAGMVAGGMALGLGRMLGHLPEPNDGTVAVEETRCDGLTDHVVLPVSHTGMLVSRRVGNAVLRFLANGQFA